jgi:carboxymethylenebutenolidase
MSAINRERIELSAADETRISAYHVQPAELPRAGLVVVQEIFGLNGHIREVADGYAAHGYEVIAPSLFDRIERGVELDYDPAGFAKGRAFAAQLGFDKPLLDIAAAVQQLASKGNTVGIVGYCWGGSVAFLAATRLDGLSAAVGYYGGAVAKHAAERPRVPVLLHFGRQDKSIPLEDVAALQKQRPELTVHLYEAGHGFNCSQRESYDRTSATHALTRTLGFLEQHLG